jgi:hypothetical protein
MAMHDKIEIITAVMAAVLIDATGTLPLALTGAHHNAASGRNVAGIVNLRAARLTARHIR